MRNLTLTILLMLGLADVHAQVAPVESTQKSVKSEPSRSTTPDRLDLLEQRLEMLNRERTLGLKLKEAELYDEPNELLEVRTKRLEQVSSLAQRLSVLEAEPSTESPRSWVSLLFDNLEALGSIGGIAIGSTLTYLYQKSQLKQDSVKMRHDQRMQLINIVLDPAIVFERRMAYIGFLRATIGRQEDKLTHDWADAEYVAHEKVSPLRVEMWELQASLLDLQPRLESPEASAEDRAKMQQYFDNAEKKLKAVKIQIRDSMPHYPFIEDSPPLR